MLFKSKCQADLNLSFHSGKTFLAESVDDGKFTVSAVKS